MRSTRIKILMEKGRLESMHYCYLTTKKHFKAQKKKKKEMDFQIHKFMLLFCPPYHALTPY
jgi:hypothetical protein